MGANTETKTLVTPKPPSPSPSSDSAPTLGGHNIEFESMYYSPYRLPTDEDEKEYVPILDHLKRMLASYIHEVAKMIRRLLMS